jgi:hypothetical protein
MMNILDTAAIEGAKSKLKRSVDQLLVEREGPQSRRHVVD